MVWSTFGMDVKTAWSTFGMDVKNRFLYHQISKKIKRIFFLQLNPELKPVFVRTLNVNRGRIKRKLRFVLVNLD